MQRHNPARIVPFPLAAVQYRTDGRSHLVAQEQEQSGIMDAAAPVPFAPLRFFLRRILFCIG
ncbi:hypothetical protein D3C73_472270 [compost metagenome]